MEGKERDGSGSVEVDRYLYYLGNYLPKMIW